MIGSLNLISNLNTIFSMAILSLSRYIRIFYDHKYNSLFSHRRTLIYCLIIWLLAILIQLPNLIGWNNYIFDRTLLVCTWNKRDSLTYNITLLIVGFLLPFVLILFAYISIFKRSKVVKKKSLSYGLQQYNEMVYSLNVTKGLFASYLFFLLTYVPFSFIYVLDYQNVLPMALHIYSHLFTHFDTIFNPILFGMTNLLFLNGYKNFMNFLMRAKRFRHSDSLI